MSNILRYDVIQCNFANCMYFFLNCDILDIQGETNDCPAIRNDNNFIVNNDWKKCFKLNTE